MVSKDSERTKVRTLLKQTQETDAKLWKRKQRTPLASLNWYTRLKSRASLVAQWLRICLPMQGTRVRALVWEDPTCRGATRSVSHNY